jgi:hypothetical protein
MLLGMNEMAEREMHEHAKQYPNTSCLNSALTRTRARLLARANAAGLRGDPRSGG